MRTDESKKSEAARIFAATGNVSRTAREVGVHRTTIQKWMKDPEFFEARDVGDVFERLQEKALRVLDDALEGKKITPPQIRAAIDIWKASNASKPSVEKKGSGLAELIALVDAEEDAVDSD